MRSEQEMYRLILDFAKADERVRAVILNGSRANPNAPKDRYQDYDIVYVVKEFSSFTSDYSWIDIFGERLMLQMPEAMRDPSGRGHFNWMMLFSDGNRLDLTLIPVEKPELMGQDSETVVLLDKDGILPSFPPASDRDYFVEPPSELFYFSCCNDFWWCLQNVAKGIARDELSYAMMMFHNVIRENLHDMIGWYIGSKYGFAVSVGKMGKYFKNYLPPELYELYRKTYSDGEYEYLWNAVFASCELFRAAALEVSEYFGYPYTQKDDENMTAYLKQIKAESDRAGEDNIMTEQMLQKKLFDLRDPAYWEFHRKLIPTVSPERIIGIRTPVLRKFAKEFAKSSDITGFLKNLPHQYYEENNLHGFIIEGMKDYDEIIDALDAFLPYVDNWATCDSISPKLFKRHLPELLEKVKEWIASGHTYTIRFGMGMLMRFYLEEAFSPEYPELVASVKSSEYYVNMMIAWYFATALAKQYEAVIPFLEQRRLDPWTHNKVIQKAVESYRITKEQKAYLRTLKMK